MSEKDTSDSLAELTQDFKNLVLERFSSPLLMSFATAWIIINYKFFLIVFSGTNINYKLHLSAWYFERDNDFYYRHSLIYPLASAIVYTFIYPFLSREIQRFVTWRKIVEMRDRQKAEAHEVFSRVDVERLNNRHGIQVARYKEDIQILKDSEAQLEAQLENYKKSATNKTKDIFNSSSHYNNQSALAEIKANLNDVELSIIEMLAFNENATEQKTLSENAILKETNVEKTQSRTSLAKLVRFSLINDLDTAFELTSLGREFSAYLSYSLFEKS